jgi:hypothetical protein
MILFEARFSQVMEVIGSLYWQYNCCLTGHLWQKKHLRIVNGKRWGQLGLIRGSPKMQVCNHDSLHCFR